MTVVIVIVRMMVVTGEGDDGYGTDGGDGCDDGCNGYGDNSGNFI